MAFFGKIPLIGIPASAVTNVGNQAVAQSLSSSFVPFVGSSLNQIAGGATEAILNVGLSSVLGASVSQQLGVPLDNGQNFLQSQISPFLTNTLAQGVNVSVTDALQNAGPLAPVLGNLAGQAVSGFAQSIAGGLGLQIPGLGGAGGTGPSQPYPGGGGEGETPADYGGGKAYALGSGGPDVVFSIRPATSPAQVDAAAAANNIPSTGVKLPANNFSGAIPNVVFDKSAFSLGNLSAPVQQTLSTSSIVTSTGLA